MALYQRPSIALTLPAELVIEICQTYLEDIQKREYFCRLANFNRLELLRKIINVSQVCQRWRDIITNCPELWCHFINPHHPSSQWRQLLLERSKQVGIAYVNRPPHIIAEASELSKEVAHADRLISYSVALQLDCRIWDDPNMQKFWPQLQNLCLAYVRDLVPDLAPLRDEDESLLLSPRFPSCISTPKLERLHLHRCIFGDASQITGLKSLKDLYVYGVRVWTIPQWLEIIQQLPHLGHLSLFEVISRTTRDEGGPSRMLDLDLEDFRLKDEKSICASFLQYCHITTSSVFYLHCLDDETLSDAEVSSIYSETLSNAEVQPSSIHHHITPIIHTLLTSNPVFSNCALRISASTIQCMGLPENLQLDVSPWPNDKQYSGAHYPSGGWFAIDLEGIDCSYLAIMFKQLLQSNFDCVDSLTIICSDEEVFFKEDVWLSDLLWQSSHRLRQLVGVPFGAWEIMKLNMLLSPDSHPSYSATVPFLYALEELGIFTPVDCDTIISDFCDRKIAMGKPLKRLKHMIPFRCLPEYPPLLYAGQSLPILPNEGSPEPDEEFITAPLPFDVDDTSSIDTSVTHQWSSSSSNVDINYYPFDQN